MSHIDHWTELQHNGKVCCDAECEEPRRDRVVFDVRKQQFVVYADRCILMRPDVIQQIVAEKALSSDVTAATDAPYRCITSECWKTAGHGGKGEQKHEIQKQKQPQQQRRRPEENPPPADYHAADHCRERQAPDRAA